MGVTAGFCALKARFIPLGIHFGGHTYIRKYTWKICDTSLAFLDIKISIEGNGFSDFVVYVVTTLIFPKNQRQYASLSINVAILFLSSNKLIDSQHYKRLRRKTPNAFHLLLHFTFTNPQLKKLKITPRRFRDWHYLFATPTYFI